MKQQYIFLAFLSYLCVCCVAPNPNNFSATSPQFKGKYKIFFQPEETELVSWYHYVKTKTPNGQYILRKFFPETMTITSEITYADASLKIVNGQSTFWWENGNKQGEGMVVKNKEEGEWNFYHRKSGKIRSIGNYKAGKQTGFWKEFDTKGRLKETLHYINDQREGPFIQYDSLQNIINEGVYKADTIFQQKKKNVDKTVEIFPYLTICQNITNTEERKACSDKEMLQHIYKAIKYPSRARKYGIEGTTITRFVIEEDGAISDLEVIVGLNEDLKQECIRVISSLPKWEAGKQNGEKVRVQFNMPIKFRLE